MNRREFIKIITGIFLWLLTGRRAFAEKYNIFSKKKKEKKPAVDKSAIRMSVIKGKNHRDITRKAVDSLGGMKNFVKRGDIVVVKPNMSWDRAPGQAANTNPEVVETVVKMCFEAGAKKVKVFDRPCAHAERSYKNSGVAETAKKAGADVFHLDEWNYMKAKFKYPSPLEKWPIYRDAVNADCFINVPILKHHSITGLTLSMKNLMGVMGGNRGNVHRDIDTKLAHLTDFISPDLTVMDATRVLVKNGPSGGRVKDVKIMDTIIAGIDPVLVDSEAARLMNKAPLEIGYIKKASEMGIGKINIDKRFIVTQTI